MLEVARPGPPQIYTRTKETGDINMLGAGMSWGTTFLMSTLLCPGTMD